MSLGRLLSDRTEDRGSSLRDTMLTLRLMEAIYIASPSPIVAIARDRSVIFWNAAADRLFGYTASEAMQLRAPFLAIAADRPRMLKLHDEAFLGRNVTGVEVVTETRSGRRVDVLVSAAPLRGPQGHIEGLVATLEDVTLRKSAEHALREGERRYRLLFEQMSDPIVVHRKGRILMANPAASQLIGMDRGKLMGHSIFDFLHPDEHQRAREQMSEHTPEPAPTDCVEYRLRRPDGTDLLVEVRSVSFQWDGERAVQLIATDLTEKRRQEEQARQHETQMRQAQKMEAIGRLAGGIAHDFNNVLTAIGGFSSLLHGELGREHHLGGYVAEIEHGVNRAASLTRQLLAFSKRQVVQAVVLDLNGVLRDLEPMLQRLLGEDVLLQLVLSGAPASVKADHSQMEQVVVNLAVNARDAMPDGGQLTIETHVVELDASYAHLHVSVDPGTYVMLAVTDTGQGMPPEIRERIFEPFYTTKATGTGLGLATVYGIVQQSGGSIWVYSEPDRGTCFKIYLPLDRTGHFTAPVAQTGCTQPEPATVLLVEDDAAVRRLTEKMLSRAGLTVMTAENGLEALALARANAASIDVVLTDVIMPEMQGPELVTILRQELPQMRAIFMSGYAEEAIARRATTCGTTPVIEKPFTSAALLSTVARVLRT